jgi:hypothetical protein
MPSSLITGDVPDQVYYPDEIEGSVGGSGGIFSGKQYICSHYLRLAEYLSAVYSAPSTPLQSIII